jgi:hypothetical protein
MIPMTAELRTFVDIEATSERVWQVMADLPAYAEWNPFVTGAEGTLAVGSRLSLSLLSVNAFVRPTLRATVLEVVPGRRLRLRSRMDRLGLPRLLEAEHTMTITPNDGGVRRWQDSHFRGLLVPLMIGSLNRRRLSSFHAMNTALKARSEGTEATHPGG